MKFNVLLVLLIIVDLVLTFFTGRGLVGLIHAMGATFITISDIVDCYVVPLLLFTAAFAFVLFRYSK